MRFGRPLRAKSAKTPMPSCGKRPRHNVTGLFDRTKALGDLHAIRSGNAFENEAHSKDHPFFTDGRN
jgi:hypothetical protein